MVWRKGMKRQRKETGKLQKKWTNKNKAIQEIKRATGNRMKIEGNGESTVIGEIK